MRAGRRRHQVYRLADGRVGAREEIARFRRATRRHGVLVPGLQAERPAKRNRSACPTGLPIAAPRRGTGRAPRSPELFTALRGSAWCLLRSGDGARAPDHPIALEEHGGPNRPTLYEYRPRRVVRRAARRPPRPPRGRARGTVRVEGRARCRHLRQRPRRRAVGETSAQSHDPIPPSSHGRDAGRLRLDDSAFERAYASSTLPVRRPPFVRWRHAARRIDSRRCCRLGRGVHVPRQRSAS